MARQKSTEFLIKNYNMKLDDETYRLIKILKTIKNESYNMVFKEMIKEKFDNMGIDYNKFPQ